MKTMSEERGEKLKIDCATMLRDCGFGTRPKLDREIVQVAIFGFWNAARATAKMHLPYKIEIALISGQYSKLVTLL